MHAHIIYIYIRINCIYCQQLHLKWFFGDSGTERSRRECKGFLKTLDKTLPKSIAGIFVSSVIKPVVLNCV